jgi:hypothetical protein
VVDPIEVNDTLSNGWIAPQPFVDDVGDKKKHSCDSYSGEGRSSR